MKSALKKYHRSFSLFLTLILACSGFSFQSAFAEGETVSTATASNGSILIDFFDSENNPISKEALKPGMRVHLGARGFTPEGKEISCRPTFKAIQGFTGNQLGDIDANGNMIVGNNMGTAEISAQCEELPGVEGKTQVANVGGLMTPAEKQAVAEQNAAKSRAAASSSGAEGALLGGVLGLAVVSAAKAKADEAAASTSSTSSSCGYTWSDCCSGGSTVCGMGSTGCGCPSGTTDRGICTSGGCVSAGYSGQRLCGC